MARTCCPQYTIRLDSTQFKPNKKHRQVMNRFNRFLETGEKPGESSTSTNSTPPTATPKGHPKGKGKVGSKGKGKGESWIDTLRECQFGYSGNDERPYKHIFEVSHTPTLDLVWADNRLSWFLLKLPRKPLSCIKHIRWLYIMINLKRWG
jgi:arginine-tRNA-protein transferase